MIKGLFRLFFGLALVVGIFSIILAFVPLFIDGTSIDMTQKVWQEVLMNVSIKCLGFWMSALAFITTGKFISWAGDITQITASEVGETVGVMPKVTDPAWDWVRTPGFWVGVVGVFIFFYRSTLGRWINSLRGIANTGGGTNFMYLIGALLLGAALYILQIDWVLTVVLTAVALIFWYGAKSQWPSIKKETNAFVGLVVRLASIAGLVLAVSTLLLGSLDIPFATDAASHFGWDTTSVLVSILLFVEKEAFSLGIPLALVSVVGIAMIATQSESRQGGRA